MEISNNFDHYVFIIYYLLNGVRVTFVPSSKLCYAGMGNDAVVTNKEIRTGSSGSRQHQPQRKNKNNNVALFTFWHKHTRNYS